MTLSVQQSFFETVYEHFRPRNDVYVRFTHTGASDMRLWAHWVSRDEKEKKQIFGTLAWRSREQTIFGRCQLLPEELMWLGIEGGQKCAATREPQKSEIWSDGSFWRNHVIDFIRAMESA